MGRFFIQASSVLTRPPRSPALLFHFTYQEIRKVQSTIYCFPIIPSHTLLLWVNKISLSFCILLFVDRFPAIISIWHFLWMISYLPVLQISKIRLRCHTNRILALQHWVPILGVGCDSGGLSLTSIIEYFSAVAANLLSSLTIQWQWNSLSVRSPANITASGSSHCAWDTIYLIQSTDQRLWSYWNISICHFLWPI